MRSEHSARSDEKRVDWGKYAEDARDLLLATSSAGPTAMRVWTGAWCEWATAAVKTQEQVARGWTNVIRDPGRGGTLLDQMREDFKQYIVDIAGIPERAVLKFLESMAETAGSPGESVSTPDRAFVKAADDFIAAAADVFNEAGTATESRGATDSATGSRGARGAAAAPAPNPLAAFNEKLSALNAARTKLGRESGQSAT